MRKLLLAACFSALALVPATASGQVLLGAHGNWSDDFDFGVGARAWVGLPTGPSLPMAVYGQFDWFFPDEPEGTDITYYEVNINLAFLFPIRNPTVAPYAAAGLNVAHLETEQEFAGLPVEASNTEVGLNIAVGTNLNLGSVTPYGEARFQISGGESFVVNAGIAIQVGPGPN